MTPITPIPQNTPAPRRRPFPKTGEVCADGAGLRDYRITWRGDSHVIRARSRTAARYASWKAFREAGYRADLPTFAGMIRIEAIRADPASPPPAASPGNHEQER